ncbi:MAG: DUF2939 domain-containing protein [Moraxella sp.]|nr:DUF2939 domain-containing protein [Moraxella sp.]
MKKIVGFVATVAVIIGVLFAGSPYYTLYRLQQNYAAHDYEAVFHQVDFVAVRGSLVPQLQTQWQGFLSSTKGSAITHLLDEETVQSFGDNLLNAGIDEVITHDNFVSIATGNINPQTQAFAAALLTIYGKLDIGQLITDSLLLGQEQAIAKQAQSLELSNDTPPKYGYCGLNCFYVQSKLADTPITAYFSRVGVLEWRMTSVQLSE